MIVYRINEKKSKDYGSWSADKLKENEARNSSGIGEET